MPTIDLKYGRTSMPFVYDEDQFEILGVREDTPPLSDIQINEKLDSPIDSKPLEEIVGAGETVLIVVPDATRAVGCGQIVNLVVRRLIANGTTPFEISIIFATGIHRTVTDAEKQQILTPFIAQRIKTIDHDPRDLARLVRLGETSGGIPVELNRAFTEHDHIILIGGVAFHYFAGFTGGRKLVCPGLASAKTVNATHKLAFDCERRLRREGVGTALLDGNAVHESFIEAASKVNTSFCISTIVDDEARVVDLFCGDWIRSHRAACDAYSATHAIRIKEKRATVIVSCGGWPYDINLIQAHKALEAASNACIEGGAIILLAECSDGLGRPDFIDWFEAENSQDLAERLCKRYQVNGQTAWSLMRMVEKFSVKVLSDIDADTLRKMRLEPISSLKAGNEKGYIFSFGAALLVKI